MRRLLLFIHSGLLLISSSVQADGTTIDKVYHPYVQPLEREVEWRMIASESDTLHKLGLGKSFTDKLFAEAYLIAKDESDTFSLEAYELEVLMQLTEQGEYSMDWGAIIELEKEHNEEAWEMSSALILEKEWGRWVGAGNFWLAYEWGNDIDTEFETAMSLQTRYRLSRKLEPALELYAGEDTRSVGPALMGDIRFAAGKKLHWESGAQFGFSDDTPDFTLRLLTEYEF